MTELILFCTLLPTDFGEPQASIQHELNLQECDPGGLGPRALHRGLTQGRLATSARKFPVAETVNGVPGLALFLFNAT